MKKLLLKFLLVSSLMGISSIGADESNLNIYEDQQSDPFVRYIDVQNLRLYSFCLLYTSPSPRDVEESRMPSSA